MYKDKFSDVLFKFTYSVRTPDLKILEYTLASFRTKMCFSSKNKLCLIIPKNILILNRYISITTKDKIPSYLFCGGKLSKTIYKNNWKDTNIIQVGKRMLKLIEKFYTKIVQNLKIKDCV